MRPVSPRGPHSTNPLEGLNGEIEHRADVVGIFPTKTPSPASSVPSCSSRTTNAPPGAPATSLWKASLPSAMVPVSGCPPWPPDRSGSRPEMPS